MLISGTVNGLVDLADAVRVAQVGGVLLFLFDGTLADETLVDTFLVPVLAGAVLVPTMAVLAALAEENLACDRTAYAAPEL